MTFANRTGWHEIAGSRVFVLPEEAIGSPDGEMVRLQQAGSSPYASRGTLVEWKAGVGTLVAGHLRLVLMCSVAFVGPLLELVGHEGGGIHVYGNSSTGKTTAIAAGSSVWGKGCSLGFILPWRQTANAFEVTAAQHTDSLLVFDEVGVADAKALATSAYQITAGTGKGRLNRDAHLKARAVWRVMLVSTGEMPVAAKIAEESGRSAHAGQLVRVLDIPADAGKGVFDHPGPGNDPSALSDAIKRAAGENYGTAGPAFVRKLLEEGSDEVSAILQGMIEAFVGTATPSGADGQVQRAAKRFALIGAAGELARLWDVVPWAEGAALDAARAAYHDWIAARGASRQPKARPRSRRCAASSNSSANPASIPFRQNQTHDPFPTGQAGVGNIERLASGSSCRRPGRTRSARALIREPRLASSRIAGCSGAATAAAGCRAARERRMGSSASTCCRCASWRRPPMRADVRDRLIALAGGVTRVTGATRVTDTLPMASLAPKQIEGRQADESRGLPSVTPVTPVTRDTESGGTAIAQIVRPKEARSSDHPYAAGSDSRWLAEDYVLPDEVSADRTDQAASALSIGEPAWTAEDYQAYFDERAAIYEHDGYRARREVECLAFGDTVRQWLAFHPPPVWEVWRGCAQCLDDDRGGDPLLPFLTRGGHTWIHDQCTARWRSHRRSEAEYTLRLMGIGPSPPDASLAPRF